MDLSKLDLFRAAGVCCMILPQRHPLKLCRQHAADWEKVELAAGMTDG